MIPGLALLAIGGLLLWQGFTGRSPVTEISALLAGDPIFVRDNPVGSAVAPRDGEPVDRGAGAGSADRPI